MPTARTLGTRMAELDRTEAERLLRAYRPRTPLAPGRVVDPAERIVRARTAFEVRKIRHSSGDPTYDRWIDHHEFTLDDGTVYSWEWHGAVYVPRGTVILCTDPASGRQVGCAIPREHVPDEVLWARPDSVQLERGTFAAGRAPLVDAAVLVVADPTEGTGLTAQEARFVLRQRAAALRRRRVGLLVPTLGLSWWAMRARLAAHAAAAQPELSVARVEPDNPFGLCFRAHD